MVAPLLRGKGPRRSYCRGGRLSELLLDSKQFGRFVTLELKTGEHRQRPTAGSAFAVLMSSPARGGSSVGQLPPKKGANIADGQLRGD